MCILLCQDSLAQCDVFEIHPHCGVSRALLLIATVLCCRKVLYFVICSFGEHLRCLRLLATVDNYEYLCASLLVDIYFYFPWLNSWESSS